MSNKQQSKAEARARLFDVARLSPRNKKMRDAIYAYEAAVVAEALAPRDASPELAEAESRLRIEAVAVREERGRKHCEAIAAELDRLRAEIVRLTSAQRTVYANQQRGES